MHGLVKFINEGNFGWEAEISDVFKGRSLSDLKKNTGSNDDAEDDNRKNLA